MPDGSPDPAKAGSLIAALEWMFDRVAAMPSGPLSEREIDRMVALYSTGAGAAGFLSNMGGLLTLPVALPANLVGVAAIQLRLISAIAAARGHDVQSEEVRTLGIACLTGGAALEVLKEAGIQFGVRLGERAIGRLAPAVLARINQAVGFRLLAQAGAGGLLNMAKVVPLVGGLVAGGFDAASTRAVGAIAKRVFAPLPTVQLPTVELPRVEPVPALIA